MYDYITKELPSVLKQFKQLDLSKVQQLLFVPIYTHVTCGVCRKASLE